MADVNHVILIGRLTRDAELKYTSGGQPVCKFGLAINRRKKQGDQWVDEANFFDVVLWGRLAELLKEYLQKGKQVAIEGSLRQERWEQDGQSRSRVEVVAESIQLLGSSQAAQGSTQSAQSKESHQGTQAKRPAAHSGANHAMYTEREDPDDGFTDDIPF